MYYSQFTFGQIEFFGEIVVKLKKKNAGDSKGVARCNIFKLISPFSPESHRAIRRSTSSKLLLYDSSSVVFVSKLRRFAFEVLQPETGTKPVKISTKRVGK